MLRRLIAAFIAAILGSGGAVTAAAPVNADTILSERGYPEIVSQYMDEIGKEELCAKTGYTYSGAVIAQYDGKDVKITEIPTDGEASINEEDGRITVMLVCSERLAGEKTPESVFVQICYNWHPLPLIRAYDLLGAYWDSELFKIQDDSFYKVDKYSGVLLDENGHLITVYKNLIQEESDSFTGDNGRISWRAKLAGITGLVVTELSGYAQFTLLPTANVSQSDTVSISAGYLHKTIIGMLSGKTVTPDMTVNFSL